MYLFFTTLRLCAFAVENNSGKHLCEFLFTQLLLVSYFCLMEDYEVLSKQTHQNATLSIT